MADAEILELLRNSQFVFEGTVTALGRSTVADVPADANTAVVNVDRVLHSPAALAKVGGSEVTVQLLAGSAPLEVGQSSVLFTTAVAFGTGIAVAEVGRSTSEAVGGMSMAAGSRSVLPGARSGRSHPVLDAAHELADETLNAHFDEVAAVITGTVVSLAKVGPNPTSEHDPDWWKATIKVDSCSKGDLKGRIPVLYPNSTDAVWAWVPKPHAGQSGLWFLHASPADQEGLASYSLLDADDYKAADHAERLSGGAR